MKAIQSVTIEIVFISCSAPKKKTEKKKKHHQTIQIWHVGKTFRQQNNNINRTISKQNVLKTQINY